MRVHEVVRKDNFSNHQLDKYKMIKTNSRTRVTHLPIYNEGQISEGYPRNTSWKHTPLTLVFLLLLEGNTWMNEKRDEMRQPNTKWNQWQAICYTFTAVSYTCFVITSLRFSCCVHDVKGRMEGAQNLMFCALWVLSSWRRWCHEWINDVIQLKEERMRH